MVDVRIFPVSRTFETVIKITALIVVLLVIGSITAIIPAPAIAVSQYTISVSTSPPGLNPQPTGGGTYDYGTTATVIAQTVDNYSFQGWTENVNQVSASASYSFTVTGDRNLVAEYAPTSPPTTPYTISVSTLPPGLNPQPTGGGTYDYGTTATVVAQTVKDYTFQRWIENGETVSTSVSYSFTVTGDRDLMAEYSPTSTSTPTIPPKAGSISVSSSPSGASIYLDGNYQGTTPKTLTDIAEGSHTITLELTGYQDWSQTINVVAGETEDVSPELTPVPPESATPVPTATLPPDSSNWWRRYLYGIVILAIILIAIAALKWRGSHQKTKPAETEIIKRPKSSIKPEPEPVKETRQPLVPEEEQKLHKCPKCGAEVHAGDRFCEECGEPLGS